MSKGLRVMGAVGAVVAYGCLIAGAWNHWFWSGAIIGILPGAYWLLRP